MVGRLASKTAFEILKHFWFDLQTHFEMFILKTRPEMANKELSFSKSFPTLIQDKCVLDTLLTQEVSYLQSWQSERTTEIPFLVYQKKVNVTVIL